MDRPTHPPEVASKYPEWLQRGFHIITPNRQVLAGPYEHLGVHTGCQIAKHVLFFEWMNVPKKKGHHAKNCWKIDEIADSCPNPC